jgi:hypothetical protein
MNESQWDLLMRRIRAGECTPFLGAGASSPPLPRAPELAREWAKAHRYPLRDKTDLAQVAQYVGIGAYKDLVIPKNMIQEKFRALGVPDFEDANELHAFLASLNLPLYLTTNYDSFMHDALEAAGKDAKRAICKWNDTEPVEAFPNPWDDPSFEATPEQPVVFHLHGVLDVVDSLVLTHDDYLDFLVAVARDRDLLPLQIREALQVTTLIFIGYGLADWNFRVLHRGLVLARSDVHRRLSVTVQFPERSKAAREYLNRYFENMKLEVFWGSTQEFVAELRSHWDRVRTP